MSNVAFARLFAALTRADKAATVFYDHAERLLRFQLIAIGVLFLAAIIVVVVLEIKWRLEEVKEGGRWIGTVKVLRCEGIPRPWKLAFDICIKQRFLPHRTYLLSDRDGFTYNPLILQWNIGPWKVWENKREMKRQRKEPNHAR